MLNCEELFAIYISLGWRHKKYEINESEKYYEIFFQINENK